MNINLLSIFLVSQLLSCITTAFQISQTIPTKSTTLRADKIRVPILKPLSIPPQRRVPFELRMADGNGNVPVTMSTPLDKPALALVDFVSLMVFAGIGKASHSSADGSLDIAAVLNTAFPFLISWYATSPFTGVYNKQENGMGLFDVGKQAAIGWVVAIPLGCVLRGLIKGYIPPAPFVVVTLIATLVILGGSRMLFSVVEKKLVD